MIATLTNLQNSVGLRLLLCPLGSNIVIRTACCSVGIALPVYSTFKAIERKDQNEQQRLLLYWAAYGSFSIVEVFSDKLLSWFPLYYHVKFAFLVWLQLPSTDGAKQLYMNHLRPFFLRHQVRIDQIMGIAYGEMLKLISAHQTEIQFARNVFVKIMGAADQMLRGAMKPDQPRQNTAIEGPLRSPDTHSDHHND
ncbi:HVA22-like protein k isoform X2 [Juglans microcarpa x Juglans regia]|uniref:HVA22-like protein k isoform X2 n=1 Tax=Juglans microcarpa x Juglans regia TaxID=2249226 RepID=UPI001B7DE7D2|nr:HVA22-like protein k isoform X2 [Juglans microcarpa x Juglans regia]